MLLTIWFLLWGLLWAIYFMLGGFDLGVGMLMPFIAKNETEKRMAAAAVGPVWKGNEVWLVTAGGVTFAAFPTVYAVMFSALYAPLMLILFALILRGVSFEFRKLSESPAGKSFWEKTLLLGSFLPTLLFGVAFANIFRGIPIDGDGVFHGTIATLLNLYGILGGVVFTFFFLSHGVLWLAAKTEGALRQRAERAAPRLWNLVLIHAVVFLIVSHKRTTLFDNYMRHPALFAVPAFAVACIIITRVFIARRAWWKAWFASCGGIAGVVMFGMVGLYPDLLPSSLDKAFTLSVHNSASTALTLKIMLAVTLVFVPIVVAYQTWAYILFKHRISENDVNIAEGY